MTYIPGNIPEPVPATNQAGEVALRAQMYGILRGWNISEFASRVCSAKGHGALPADICEAELDAFGEAFITALATQPATSPCPDCKGTGYSGGVIPAEPELCDACETCFGEGVTPQPATSQEGGGLALRAIKAVTATTKDGAAGLARIMAITNAVGVHAPYSDLLQDPAVALIVERPRTEWAHLFKPDATGCAIPPEGWRCSRARGHTGPCAATPTPPTLSEDLREVLDEARRQLEYLDGRWPTGTTPAIIARIDAALAKVKAS